MELSKSFDMKNIAEAGEKKPNIVKDVVKGTAVVFCGRGVKAVECAKDDPGKAVAFAGMQANKLPDTQNDLIGSYLALKQIYDHAPEIGRKISEYSKEAKDPVDALKKMSEDKDLVKYFYNPKITEAGAQITEFGLLKDTFAEKWLSKSQVGKTVLALDKNLLDTNCGKNIIKAFDKSAEIVPKKVLDKVTKEEKIIKYVAGNKKATFAAKTLGRIPLLNVLISLGLEIPNLVKAAKNGDLGPQIGRSVINIIGISLGSGMLGAAMSPLIPPLGSLIGTALGGYLAGKVCNAAGQAIFGKPKTDHNEELAQKNIFEGQKVPQLAMS